MTHHPARSWAFGDLAAALRAEADRGAVTVRRCAERPGLAIYTYTDRATYDAMWTPVVEMARGLVLDHDNHRVVATPFPKFFNLGERGLTPPAEPFEAFEKLDGSLGVLAHDGERWRVTTKGAFASAQALWAEAWVAARDTSALVPGTTYCFEIVYPENRIVVSYQWAGLVLLAAYGEDGREWSYPELVAVAAALGTRAAERYAYPSVAALVEAAAAFRADREGFVVRFASGFRLKVKGAEYLRVHRLVSRVTPLALWEALAAGDDLDAIRAQIPEEFWTDFDAIRSALDARLASIVGAAEAEAAKWEGASDRDVGLALKTIDEPARSLIFPRRKGGAQWLASPRARLAVCRMFRPDGNALDGYVPGSALRRFADAEVSP